MTELGITPLWYAGCSTSVMVIFRELFDTTYFDLQYYTGH